MILPPNAFEILNLSPEASGGEIIRKILSKMKESPQDMKRIADLQTYLLNPRSRFLIRFLYYPCLDGAISTARSSETTQ